MGPLIVVTFLLYAWLEHTVLSNKEISWSFRVLASGKKKWTSSPLCFYAGTRKGIFKPIPFLNSLLGYIQGILLKLYLNLFFLIELNCLSSDILKTLLCKWMFCDLTCIILKRNPLPFYIFINNTIGRVKAW